MALVIALAINNGFRGTLQRNLLTATAHVSILEKEPGYGIENWRELVTRLRQIPGVTSAAPTLYGQVMMVGRVQSTGAILKGVEPALAAEQTEMLAHLKEGSIKDLDRADTVPGIVLGSKLAQSL